jgi:hypothetical protein
MVSCGATAARTWLGEARLRRGNGGAAARAALPLDLTFSPLRLESAPPIGDEMGGHLHHAAGDAGAADTAAPAGKGHQPLGGARVTNGCGRSRGRGYRSGGRRGSRPRPIAVRRRRPGTHGGWRRPPAQAAAFRRSACQHAEGREGRQDPAAPYVCTGVEAYLPMSPRGAAACLTGKPSRTSPSVMTRPLTSRPGGSHA